MVQQKQDQMMSNKSLRPPVRRPGPAQQTLTPKEILGILRRHILLIVLMTVLGLVLGGTGWYLMLKFCPKYTARTAIKVLPPVEKDPMMITSPQVNKDIQFGHRLSIAGRIKQQSSLIELIQREAVQRTAWFEQFGGTKTKRLRKAFKNLKKHFGAHAVRDVDSVILTMTCAKAEESAKIVNEMVRLFLATQTDTTQKEVAERLAQLREQKANVESELRLAEGSMDQIRDQYNIYDLDERNFEHVITKRLR